MGFWVAVQFLTIFPTPLRGKLREEGIGSSLACFPLVGLGIGAVLVGLNYGLGFVLPRDVVNALLIVALVIVTGAHHLDGFIDTCDGVFAGQSPAERLAIMRDSRTGAFGVIGAVLLLLVKYAALSSTVGLLRMPTLIVMPTLSRWAMVGTVFLFPYARTSGLGLAFKKRARWYWLVIATVIALAVSIGLLKLLGLFLVMSLVLVIISLAAYFRSRLEGLTGDTYGAINEIAEVMVLVLIILFHRWF